MTDPVPFPLPCTVGKYSLLRTLGSGAFSVVYNGENNETGETIAMKVIAKSILKDQRDIDHLQRELDTITYLKHDNIVSLKDFFSDPSYFYLVLDYCQGGNLMDILCSSQKMREPIIANIFHQLASAVQFCHRHDVVHRDLKPQNILITKFPSIKIADFGLCGYVVSNEKMKTFCGSPCYTAPECLSRTQYDGKAADVWSLGVILYELATLEHPWPVTNTVKMVQRIQKAQYTIPQSVPPALAELIKSMMKLNPKERPTCEVILANPWLRLAGARARAEALPPLSPVGMSMALFTSSFDRRNETKDNGIANPFVGAPPMISATPRTTRQRAGSVNQRCAARKQIGASQLSLELAAVPREDGPSSAGRYSRGSLPPVPKK